MNDTQNRPLAQHRRIDRNRRTRIALLRQARDAWVAARESWRAQSIAEKRFDAATELPDGPERMDEVRAAERAMHLATHRALAASRFAEARDALLAGCGRRAPMVTMRRGAPRLSGGGRAPRRAPSTRTTSISTSASGDSPPPPRPGAAVVGHWGWARTALLARTAEVCS